MFFLNEQINKRVIDDWLMRLRIATNPHLDEKNAKSFFEELLSKRQAIWGVPASHDKLDKEAFELFKQQLQANSKSIKVK